MEQVREILRLAQFPEEAEKFFWSAWQTVVSDKRWLEFVKLAAVRISIKEDSMAIRQKLAEETNLHIYSVDMLVLLYAYAGLRETYKKQGYSDALFIETLADLRYKLAECREVKGVLGTFAYHWYPGFFDCTRFKLGRLQYEYFTPTNDCGGMHPAGEPLLRCHIPSAGPLTREMVLDSLQQAYTFFGFTGPMALHCASWLLYPPHYEVYPEGSNLRMFYDLFNVYAWSEDTENKNCWRVMGSDSPDPEDWKLTTSLRKRFHKYLAAGNNMGMGRGILFYTPEKGVYKEKA